MSRITEVAKFSTIKKAHQQAGGALVQVVDIRGGARSFFQVRQRQTHAQGPFLALKYQTDVPWTTESCLLLGVFVDSDAAVNALLSACALFRQPRDLSSQRLSAQ